MRMTLASIALFALAGCGGGSTDPTDPPPTNLTYTCDTGNCDTGGPVGPQYIDPVAVGFEVRGNLHDDGTIHPIILDDGSEQGPFVILTFAGEDYFGADSTEAQAGLFCEVGATLAATPKPFNDPAIDSFDGQPLAWSYETNLILEWEFQDTGCGTVLDPAVYGQGGVDLISQFDGMHFGFGFGNMTERLWSGEGKDDPANDDFRTEIFGVYIAANDNQGHFGGCDWDYGFLFELNEAGVAIEDPDNAGFLKPIEVGTLGTGPLPMGYLSTGASWYQDFPLMAKTSTAPWDFSHMADDPVPGAPICGDW